MKIIIIANFPSVFDGKPQGRFTYLAKMLYEKGHDIEFIVSDFEHGAKKKRKIIEGVYPYKVTYLHETGYPDNISLKRLWSHHVWGKNVRKHLGTVGKVDVVYAAVPSLTAAKAAADYCKKSGAKFIVDVQDLWPEAFQVVVPRFVKPAFAPIGWYINYAYRAADLVVGVSDTYRDRALRAKKKGKEGLSVFLGNDGDIFEKSREAFRVERPENEFWIAYIGTVGYSYDLKCVIDAVKIVNDRGVLEQTVKFVAMGRGPLLKETEAYAEKAQIAHEFTGALPYQQMVGLLCSCDVVVNCIKKNAAQSVTNKVGDYALSGLPVINTQESPEYRALVDEYKCGINCRCENAQDVADAIEQLALDEKLRKTMGANSARLGNEKFDRRTTYQAIVEAVEKCVK